MGLLLWDVQSFTNGPQGLKQKPKGYMPNATPRSKTRSIRFLNETLIGILSLVPKRVLPRAIPSRLSFFGLISKTR